MLSDEERKAIKEVKHFNQLTRYWQEEEYEEKEIAEYITTILNLIEKQSKEIEELKKYKEGYKLLSYSLDNYTSKDKIKAKIEESELLIDNSQGCMSNEDLYKEFGKIEFGKSLLEKE